VDGSERGKKFEEKKKFHENLTEKKKKRANENEEMQFSEKKPLVMNASCPRVNDNA
jgi:hypothetical protein